MGLMDKVKKILFDEDEVEIPVNSNELPEKPQKKPKKEEKSEKRGFIDYHNEDTSTNVLQEEDTIKEVIVPKDDEVVEPKSSFNFPIDFDYEPEVPQRTRFHEEETLKVAPEPKRERHVEEHKEVKAKPEKDYRKYLEEKDDKTAKKPFKATPIISPVYGILDKNYTPQQVKTRKEVSEEVQNEANKVRSFGPVSYNDEPLPGTSEYNEKVKNKSMKEDLKEINSTISDLIDDSVKPGDERDIMTSGIEEEYIGHNNIEDAFDTTSEYDKINEHDKYSRVPKTDDSDKGINIDEIMNSTQEPELDNTIETDLFNLIDSMYKSDDSEEE